MRRRPRVVRRRPNRSLEAGDSALRAGAGRGVEADGGTVARDRSSVVDEREGGQRDREGDQRRAYFEEQGAKGDRVGVHGWPLRLRFGSKSETGGGSAHGGRSLDPELVDQPPAGTGGWVGSTYWPGFESNPDCGPATYGNWFRNPSEF